MLLRLVCRMPSLVALRLDGLRVSTELLRAVGGSLPCLALLSLGRCAARLGASSRAHPRARTITHSRAQPRTGPAVPSPRASFLLSSNPTILLSYHPTILLSHYPTILLSYCRCQGVDDESIDALCAALPQTTRHARMPFSPVYGRFAHGLFSSSPLSGATFGGYLGSHVPPAAFSAGGGDFLLAPRLTHLCLRDATRLCEACFRIETAFEAIPFLKHN